MVAGVTTGLPLDPAVYDELDDVADAPQAPRTKAEAQAILKRFGYTAYLVSSIADPVPHEHVPGVCEVHVYVLTRAKLMENGKMERQARTVVLHIGQEEVRASDIAGWVVP